MPKAFAPFSAIFANSLLLSIGAGIIWPNSTKYVVLILIFL